MILVRAVAGRSISIAACSEFAVTLMIEHRITGHAESKSYIKHIHANSLGLDICRVLHIIVSGFCKCVRNAWPKQKDIA
jgi:hypothetical protein